MIKLDTEEYCQNCTEFEPTCDVDKPDTFFGEVEVNTTVTCRHKQKCAEMYEHLSEWRMSNEK